MKLISLDLDGTLLNIERKIPDGNRRAIQKVTENGVTVIVSTGSPYNLLPHDELSGLDIQYAITANGSAIYEYKTGKCIYEEAIETDAVLPILEYLLTKDIHIDMFIKGKAYCPSITHTIVDKLEVPRARKEYIQNNRIWLDKPINYIVENQLRIQKISLNFYPDKNGNMVDREIVGNQLSQNSDINLVSSAWGNLEITKKGVNKGRALKKLCEMKCFSIEDTIAMGDSLNDLDIIQAAGTGVAMGNSIQVILDAADYITEKDNECGVAEAIEFFFQK